MELGFDKKQNFHEQIMFIRRYAQWVKKMPNTIWSKQQAEFLESLYANNKHPLISPETYLSITKKAKMEKK
jgi:hypothetical protein